jgi:hypothetical protein
VVFLSEIAPPSAPPRIIALAVDDKSAFPEVLCPADSPRDTTSEPTSRHPIISETREPPPLGTRVGYQFNDEPAIIWVSDGRGGPPLLFHGRYLSANELKSVRRLTPREVRDRFGDQQLDAAFLIELKQRPTPRSWGYVH